MSQHPFARGVANLGQAIDARLQRQTTRLVYPRDLGPAQVTAQSNNMAAGSLGNAIHSAGLAVPVVYFMPGVSFVPHTLIAWDEGAVAPHAFRVAPWPAEASLAPVTAEPQKEVIFQSVTLGRSSASFVWSSEATGEAILTGSALGLGFACAKAWQGDARSSLAFVRASLRVENTARLSALHLVLNDVDNYDAPVHQAALDVLPGLTGGSWQEVSLAETGIDLSTWTARLRVGLIALGTENPADTGATLLEVGWLQVELWPAL